MNRSICMIACLGTLFSVGFTTAQEHLGAFRDQYEKELGTADAAFSLEVLRVVNLYVARLETLDERARQDGDLDAVSEIRSEIKRVRNERSLPDSLSERESLASLQTVLAETFHRLDVNRAERILTLTEKYAQALEQVQRSLVQQNNIHEAVALRDERESVEESERVVAARALIKRADQPPRLARRRPDHIPEDAVEFKGRFYFLVEQDLTWDEALAYCRELGGRLAAPDSEELNEILKQIQVKAGKHRVFLGVQDKTKEGVWMDVADKELTYENWGRGEPNNAGESEHVAEMRTTGQWNDVSATMRFPFFCEW